MRRTPWGDAETLRSRRLPPGRGTSPDVVAANHRERLLAATVTLCDERELEAIRVDDLIALAGVSRGAFYRRFGSRDECVVATVDAVVDLALDEITSAVARGGEPAARVRALVDGLVGFAVSQPAAARLWLVTAYGAGGDAIAAAERGIVALRNLAGSPLAELAREGHAGDGLETSAREIPPDVLAGACGGLARTLARRLRLRRDAELPSLAEPLTAWLAAYRPPPVPLRRPRGRTADRGGGRAAPQDQVERILLGTCDAVAQKGFAGTTIADVARAASTSIRTFYAHYEGKREALVDAIDLAQAQSAAAARTASRRAPDWPGAVRNGVGAICGYFAADPALADAVIVESHAAGDEALARRDESIETVAALLAPGCERTPDLAPLASEAIAGAIETLAYDAVRAGGGPRLRAIVPTATYLALAPFLGPADAATAANDTGQPRRRQQ